MGPRHFNLRGQPAAASPGVFDQWFLLAAVALILIGLLMVASSSVVISEKQFHQPFHYVIRQATLLLLGSILAVATLRVPLSSWQKIGPISLIISIVMLALVLLPGLGHSVNGSQRWLGVGAFRIQVSEIAKLSLIVYLADYLCRRQHEVRTQMIGFVKPMAIIALMSVLLLREPDFGSVVVMLFTALTMMFLAGVGLWQFGLLLCGAGCSVGALAIMSPYRLARLTSFLDPWSRQFDSGYQLTQSLIAFGRGGWSGVGLGESIQKLFYLPEAHTDFLFAVLAEEFGLIGTITVIALFSVLIYRGLLIAKRALVSNQPFHGYCAVGLSMWLGLQAMINIGVNSGVLPTKGLTLPLMSYGGSSILVNCMVIALIIRIDYEVRHQHAFSLNSD